ncbi:MAG TPA: hypothetical protein PK186_05285 [candidate division Zixibacteria bacterium]|nr:hypothetical protein [candidate division Zixibacteria bacterium]MDD4917661.1 hypothetical protein [candidate division Zixibacteria bacterium]MDM7974065.1 hypothetical protein [candidate division Zixibacteria bacterium]HOD65521.1 hypothetical protein [candidate division Zixibacteria bacterium]HPM36959.1 hypothetical protein [candidate division Zixibacteria bacterium]
MREARFSQPCILAATAIMAALLAADLDACTAFIVRQGHQVLVANNEDWTETNVRVWFVPGSPGRHGAVYFGFADTPGGESREGGMNDEGLFFDGFGAPAIGDSNPLNKPLYQDSVGFPDKALAECGSVEEVTALASQFHLPLHHAMWMFGDRYGNSIIIEGEKAVAGDGRYQICTNFRQSELQGDIAPCWRYRTADSLLENMPALSVAYCRDILDAVHLKITQYSYILDPNSGQIYFYHFHDYSQVVQVNLVEELTAGPHYIDMLPRFPRKLGVTLLAEQGKACYLSFSMVFFAASLIVWAGRVLFRRIVRVKPTGSLAQRSPGAAAGLIAGVLCAVIGAYLVVLLGYPEMIPYSQENASGHSPFLRFVLLGAPWLGAALLGASIYYGWAVWKTRAWRLVGRAHYTLLALIASADVVIWVAWGIIP